MFATPRLSARAWLALAAGIGCGVCGYAGLYPRFDEGALRLILGATSAPFAAAVVAYSLSARSASRAFGRALLLSGLLGAASIVIPAAVLTHLGNDFVGACLFGSFFGAVTGVLYGVPLAILASKGHQHLQTSTHDATDRAARVAGVWLAVLALVALLTTRGLDRPVEDYATHAMTYPSTLPTIVACLAALAGIGAVALATLRLKRRRAFIERVRLGLEPAFRMRVADPRDPIAALPRLGDGATVIEVVLDEASGSAYRVSAAGTAVALVSDP